MSSPNVAHDFQISGIASLIGKVISMGEWAKLMRVPDRKTGGVLRGERMEEILGVTGKSWDPELFADPSIVSKVGKAALASAGLEPGDIDAFLVLTLTPYELTMGQDGFRFARDIGFEDHVVPILLETGCGGLARAMSVLTKLACKRALVLTYNFTSLHGYRGKPNPLYLTNEVHPQRENLWASPALFSDGIAAMVLERTGKTDEVSFYSRDQHSFGDKPGFHDPIVHFTGGGALNPPGFDKNEQLMTYSMSGRIIAEYYHQGMMLNHRRMRELWPYYDREAKRIYTHQAGPKLVTSFVKLAEIEADKVPMSAARLGNLVSPCTIQLLDDDLASGAVSAGDRVCFSVIGAGPERGAFSIRLGTPTRAPIM